MVDTSASIEKLDSETCTRLRSTQILTSLPQIISELVQNSLDAGAKQVDVGFNLEEWGCWVRDDGIGISKDDLRLLFGGADGRYVTSKAYEPSSLDRVTTFGFRGEAISSAADLSCIEISSRTARSRESWSVLLKGGKRIHEGPSLRWRREVPGTTVSVRDAFYNLPIRRLSHPSTFRALEMIKRQLQTFALITPHVSFSLQDDIKHNKEGGEKGRVLYISGTSSHLEAFRRIFGKALVEHVEEFDVAQDEMRLEGFISLHGAHSKSYQFLYVNQHLLDPCELHRVIDRKFTASSFGKHTYDESGETESPRPAYRRSPRKAERKPIFVLNFRIPRKDTDNCLDPAKAVVHFRDQDKVSTFLIDVIQSFLIKHGFTFSLGLDGVQPYSGSPSPRKRRHVIVESNDEVEDVDMIEEPVAPFPLPVESTPVCISGDPFANGEPDIPWTDPITKKTYLIDPRTGNSRLQDEGNLMSIKPSNRGIVDTQHLNRTGLRKRDTEGNYDGMPSWIQNVLKSSNAFPTGEREIPTSQRYPHTSSSSIFPHHNHPHPRTTRTSESYPLTNTESSESLGWLDKESFKDIEVLNQVDRKFIACVIHHYPPPSQSTSGTTGERTLVLVDQHAADERVRVERYLKALCTDFLSDRVKTVELEPAKPVLLTRAESSLLKDHQPFREAFRRWGFTVSFSSPVRREAEDTGEKDYAQIYVSTVPEVVSIKLIANGELQEVFKGYLAKLESEEIAILGPHDVKTSKDVGEFTWLEALRYCPPELVNLVNSRACRGAIMFNDELTLAQCKTLLYKISKTAFPFQCAHGRPSLMPIGNVANAGESRPRAINWGNFQ